MKVNHYLNSVLVEPNNSEELQIDITYDKDGNKRSASINNWVFGVNDLRNPNDAIKIIDAGLANGQGISEGLPFSIYVDNQKGKTYNIFDGYVDMWKAKYLCNERTAPAIEQGQIDWLNTVADSVTYEYLYQELHFFTNDYFFPVPYVINRKQSAFEIAVTALSIYIIAQEIKSAILEIAKLTVEAGAVFTTIPAILKLILQLAYITTLLIALTKLLVDLFNNLIQPVKYHNCMYALDSVRIGLQYLGLGFSSTILESDDWKYLTILPEKFNLKEDNTGKFKNLVGYFVGNKNEKEGYYKGTVGDLLRDLKLLFNAKIIINNGVLYLEKQDFDITNGNYILPNIMDEGYTLNHEEFASNTVIKFQTDLNDRNTLQKYAGTEIQITQQPNVVLNPRMSLMRNINTITFQYSRGVRKEKFNVVEEIFNDFFKIISPLVDGLIQIINDIINIINGIIDLLNKVIKLLDKIGLGGVLGSIPSIPSIPALHLSSFISRRKNMLMMESDYVSTKKLLMVKNTGDKNKNILLPTNEIYINAEYLYDNFHYFNNFVTTNGWNNQKKIFTATGIPFTFNDYEKVRTNSLFNDSNGKECRMLELKWNPRKQVANITYFRREIYLTNINLTKIVING